MHNGSAFFGKNSFYFLVLEDSTDMNRMRHDFHRRIYLYKHDIDPIIHMHAFRETFVNANLSTQVLGQNMFDDYFNYFMGKDPKQWASHVQAFGNLTYQSIYNHIDLNVSSVGVNLKYDFDVKVGGKAADISILCEGIDGIRLTGNRIIMKTSVGDVIDETPYAYQMVNGAKSQVPCDFVLNGNLISFSFPNGYDAGKELIIDPVLIFFVTYSGSTADNFGYSATYDSHGNAYAAGTVFFR